MSMKTEKFVKLVMKNDNVKAQKMLEDIVKEKVVKKIADTLKS